MVAAPSLPARLAPLVRRDGLLHPAAPGPGAGREQAPGMPRGERQREGMTQQRRYDPVFGWVHVPASTAHIVLEQEGLEWADPLYVVEDEPNSPDLNVLERFAHPY